jgi:hypothetical protein
MLVVYRNGQRTVIRGWRAWLIFLSAALLAALILVTLISLLLGVALTATVFVLFGLPLAIALALILQLFQFRR